MTTEAMKTIHWRPTFKTDRVLFILFPLVTVSFTLLSAVLALLGWVSGYDRNGSWPHRVSQAWARCLLFLSPVKIRVIGEHYLDEGPFVIVSNHLSAFDNALGLACFPIQFRYFGHRRFFRCLPTMYLAQYIPVDRDKPHESRLRLLDRGSRFLQQKISMFIFAEGTRSRDGKLRSFKSGAFELAVKNGIRVLPIAIQGSFEAMAKGSFRLRPVDITLQILKPLEVEESTDIEKLRDQAHAAIAQALGDGA